LIPKSLAADEAALRTLCGLNTVGTPANLIILAETRATSLAVSATNCFLTFLNNNGVRTTPRTCVGGAIVFYLFHHSSKAEKVQMFGRNDNFSIRTHDENSLKELLELALHSLGRRKRTLTKS
jgi:hypothetical protein